MNPPECRVAALVYWNVLLFRYFLQIAIIIAILFFLFFCLTNFIYHFILGYYILKGYYTIYPIWEIDPNQFDASFLCKAGKYLTKFGCILFHRKQWNGQIKLKLFNFWQFLKFFLLKFYWHIYSAVAKPFIHIVYSLQIHHKIALILPLNGL